MKKIYFILAAMLLAGCGMQSRQDESTMDYPQAEWDKAGVTVEWVPLESLIDGYGAAHCMTQVLQRASRP